MNGGHTFAGGRKGDFLHARITGIQCLFGRRTSRNQRCFSRFPQYLASLFSAVGAQRRKFQYLSDSGSIGRKHGFDIPNSGHRHTVTGKGTGFVRTNHTGASQGLHRRQTANNSALACHTPYSHSQHDGYYRWQSLRDGGYSKAHRDHKHL